MVGPWLVPPTPEQTTVHDNVEPLIGQVAHQIDRTGIVAPRVIAQIHH